MIPMILFVANLKKKSRPHLCKVIDVQTEDTIILPMVRIISVPGDPLYQNKMSTAILNCASLY